MSTYTREAIVTHDVVNMHIHPSHIRLDPWDQTSISMNDDDAYLHVNLDGS